jgi:hypothetical protein
MVRLATASFALASLATLAQGFSVTAPSANTWWVAKSLNVLTWDCKASDAPATFTVLIANKDPKVLVAPLAIIGIEQNFDCSKEITQDQSNQPAGTGYTILLADPLNNTHVYATSDEFEIKPLGSSYPSQASPSSGSNNGASGTASGTGTSSSSKPTQSNSALGLSMEAGWVLAGLGAMLGLVAA